MTEVNKIATAPVAPAVAAAPAGPITDENGNVIVQTEEVKPGFFGSIIDTVVEHPVATIATVAAVGGAGYYYLQHREAAEAIASHTTENSPEVVQAAFGFFSSLFA